MIEHIDPIFIDFEFTDFESMQLISVGAVSNSNNFYYEEDFNIELCSDFVKEHVLPKLVGLKPGNLKKLFEDYMEENKGPIIVDSSFDLVFLKDLVFDKRDIYVLNYKIEAPENLHNALIDAMILKDHYRIHRGAYELVKASM